MILCLQIHYYKKYELLPYYWMLWKLPLDINETANPIVAFQPPFDKRSIHLIVCLGISLLWSSSCVYNIFCFPNHTLMDLNSNDCLLAVVLTLWNSIISIKSRYIYHTYMIFAEHRMCSKLFSYYQNYRRIKSIRQKRSTSTCMYL